MTRLICAALLMLILGCARPGAATPPTATPIEEPEPPTATPRPPEASPTAIPPPSAIGRTTPPPTPQASAPGHPDRLSLALDGAPWVGQAGLFLARERGYFGEVGVDVHFDVAASREASMKMLVGGRSELALVGGLDLLRARAEGSPVLSVYAVIPHPLPPLKPGAPDYYELVVATTEGVHQTRPDALRAFAAGLVKGQAEAARSPEGALDVLMRANQALDRHAAQTAAVGLANVWREESSGEQTEPRWRQTVAWLATQGVLKVPLDPSKVFSNELLPKPTPPPFGPVRPPTATPSGPTPTPVARPAAPAAPAAARQTVITIGP